MASPWIRTAARLEVGSHTLRFFKRGAESQSSANKAIGWPAAFLIRAEVFENAPGDFWHWRISIGGKKIDHGRAKGDANARAQVTRRVRLLAQEQREEPEIKAAEAVVVARMKAEGYSTEQPRDWNAPFSCKPRHKHRTMEEAGSRERLFAAAHWSLHAPPPEATYCPYCDTVQLGNEVARVEQAPNLERLKKIDAHYEAQRNALVADAAEAVEKIDPDELEAHAKGGAP